MPFEIPFEAVLANLKALFFLRILNYNIFIIDLTVNINGVGISSRIVRYTIKLYKLTFYF